MGKKSKRAGRNKPKLNRNQLKRSKQEISLAALDLPIPLPIDAATPPRNNRQLADHCLENFPLLDKEDDRRFSLWSAWIVSLSGVFEAGREEAWYKRHVKFLRKIANDEAELTYFRVECLFFLSGRLGSKCDLEGTIDGFEKIAMLCNNASELEKSRRLSSGLTVGDELSKRRQIVEAFIDKSYNQALATVYRSPTEAVEVPISAGNQCDNCRKTKAELNVDRLSCCTRCQFEYYCSKECQRSAWKKGHKQLCHAPGQFHVGDQALTGEVSQQEPQQVQLLQYVEKEDSWAVVEIWSKNQCTVPTKDLRRLRPALWDCPEAFK